MAASYSPGGSPAGSMTSSPAPTQLTPRSKVRAMLSALDDDSGSDKENATSRPNAVGKTRAGSGSPRKNAVRARMHRMPFQDDTSDEDGLGKSVKSPTKAQTGPQKRELTVYGDKDQASPKSSSDEAPGGNAYERIKRQMLNSKAATSPRPASRRQSHSPGGQAPRSFMPSDVAAQRLRTVSPPSLAPSSTGSPVLRRKTSPGLFVSPAKSIAQDVAENANDAHSSDSADEDGTHAARNRLQALVARKRAEREAKERETRQISSESASEQSRRPKKQKKHAKRHDVQLESEDDLDREAAAKLTQQARPTRKASKKAIEEMNRETQRMSRNMQLTHEARTKMKFSTADLFKKLGFRQPQGVQPVGSEGAETGLSSVAPSSDVEQADKHDTPPSSPPSRGPSPPKAKEQAPVVDLTAVENSPENSSDDELPSMQEMLTRPAQSEKSPVRPQPSPTTASKSAPTVQEKPSLRKFAKSAKPAPTAGDSDDDLEIVKPTKLSRIKAFEDIPTRKMHESHSLHALKALAHLNEHHSSKGKPRDSLTTGELKFKLQKRARDQAAMEKAEKIQALRDKGVIVQTEEEREGEQLQIENMLEKARTEADELAKKEKEARKREGKDEDGGDGLPDSDDEDEDYQGSDDAGADVSGSENEAPNLSGSEDEGDAEDDERADDEEEEDEEDIANAEAEDNAAPSNGHGLVDDEAGEDDEDKQESVEGSEAALEDEHPAAAQEYNDISTPRIARSKPRRKTIVESDEEDSDTEPPSTAIKSNAIRTPKADLAGAFGFAQHKSPGLGLSQIFGGTMAETQTQGDDNIPIDPNQDSLAFLRGLPPMDQATLGADFDPGTQVQDSQNDAEDSSIQDSVFAQPFMAIDTQSQRPFFETQQSEMLEATQDAGFQTVFSPARPLQMAETQDTHSTVDTVMLPPDSPILRRKNRLVRGKSSVLVKASQDPPQTSIETGQDDDEDSTQNAFLIMKKASKKPAEPDVFDKKQSKAKGMFEEQAEESEDEYAGLGGASDDDSQGEMDEETKRMIDNTGNERLNAGQVAARYHAQKLADDEKETSKLYKDITTGGLRRKRGAGVDLLDSDNEDEAIARRRAAKQREFAKMRKALLADEKIGKIADNPKRQAFLQSLADQAEDEELNFLDAAEDSQSQPTAILASQQPLAPTTGNAQKRKRSDGDDAGTEFVHAEDGNENRAPPHLRRTDKPKAFRPPPSDIRRTLSELIGEPEEENHPWNLQCETHYDAASDASENSDNDEDNSLYRDVSPPIDAASPKPAAPSPIMNPRRTHPTHTRKATIDRMALNRQSSLLTSANNNNNNNNSTSDRLAFAAAAPPTTSSFRIPSLLRRATTNNASHSHASADTSQPEGYGSGSGSRSNSVSQQGLGGMGKEGVKMGGTSKSSVNYYVREAERRKRLEEGERERVQAREGVGRLRRTGSASGLGGLGGGVFG